MIKFSDPSSGFTLADEPGKQSQKVHRRHRIPFLDQPHRRNLANSIFLLTLLLPSVNGITPINSSANRPIHSSAALHHMHIITNHHHDHQLLIVATIKLKQIAIAIRNDLAMSVVIENSLLVVIQLDLTPIGD
jgi:hypothetical protein